MHKKQEKLFTLMMIKLWIKTPHIWKFDPFFYIEIYVKGKKISLKKLENNCMLHVLLIVKQYLGICDE